MAASPSTPGAATAGVSASASHLGADPSIVRRLSQVRNIILVLSGKGGVGKSSVSAQLALSLSSTPITDDDGPTTGPSSSSSPSSSSPTPSSTPRTPRVGILDIDLTGPSIPRMLGLDGQTVKQSSDGWVPVYTDASQSLAVMSVGFLLRSKNDSVVWRGPKKNAMIKQFLGDVRWGPLDYLVIDTPPGTSDEHISILEYLRTFQPSAVMVTTPQAVSLADNLRSLDFTRKTNLPLLGLIENMSGYVCPHCEECTNVWGKGGGEALAQRERIHFLGRIPIDPGLVRVLDDAKEEAQAKVQTQNGSDASAAAEIINQPLDAHETAATSSAPASAAAAAPAPASAPVPASAAAAAPSASAAASSTGQHDDSATPAGTILSRTTIQRYRDSQTFPIFQKITDQIRDLARQHRNSSAAGQ
ncbi:uncharacterized protein PFL1_02274 [Pseudozyma flocculosa PF-1]|uniref:Related to nucleotide binding protein (NBP 2) n=1 Tax=Pseudozyma flocculosa TaxID=84751 RepID=A0A5C3F8D3_9BASI|nr:uncharacterized protein PFL1_02274 [Pseudozyma flocculosa PF-1]EPQ30158.1 hypothetical protein PFL1_02274 [Pseudozyma flocculosa PF-1]SPO39915.1 related to nucleotide binding protein (NBP 2) [Pseudozyma flocculosa]